MPCWLKAKVIDAVKKTKKLGEEDPRRIVHSLKAGLALTLVSLFYYFLYDNYGESGLWAVITVVVLFEFTVGATLSKAINRGFATLLAGALGVGASYFARLHGDKAEYIVLCILVFVITAVATFIRFLPSIKRRYDYGVLIFLLTFNMVSMAGYNVDEIMKTAHQRLSTVVAGAAICIMVSVLVFPVWAGEALHNLVASNIEKLGNFMEGFGAEYFKVAVDGDSGGGTKGDKSFLKDYGSVLNSKPNELSMMNFAMWEPGHGNFRRRHPWGQYSKIGDLVRKCAYHVEAISNYINSEVQVPPEFLRKIQEPCMQMSSDSGRALKELASAFRTLTHPSSVYLHIENTKAAAAQLEIAMEAASGESCSNLLEIVPAIMVASTLTSIMECIEKIAEAINELSRTAHFKRVDPDEPDLNCRVSAETVRDGDHVAISVDASMESHENEKPQAPKATDMA
ncbi:hypothetical protein NMG60_11001553 [Bertholletia excelsa]